MAKRGRNSSETEGDPIVSAIAAGKLHPPSPNADSLLLHEAAGMAPLAPVLMPPIPVPPPSQQLQHIKLQNQKAAQAQQAFRSKMASIPPPIPPHAAIARKEQSSLQSQQSMDARTADGKASYSIQHYNEPVPHQRSDRMSFLHDPIGAVAPLYTHQHQQVYDHSGGIHERKGSDENVSELHVRTLGQPPAPSRLSAYGAAQLAHGYGESTLQTDGGALSGAQWPNLAQTQQQMDQAQRHAEVSSPPLRLPESSQSLPPSSQQQNQLIYDNAQRQPQQALLQTPNFSHSQSGITPQQSQYFHQQLLLQQQQIASAISPFNTKLSPPESNHHLMMGRMQDDVHNRSQHDHGPSAVVTASGNTQEAYFAHPALENLHPSNNVYSHPVFQENPAILAQQSGPSRALLRGPIQQALQQHKLHQQQQQQQQKEQLQRQQQQQQQQHIKIAGPSSRSGSRHFLESRTELALRAPQLQGTLASAAAANAAAAASSSSGAQEGSSSTTAQTPSFYSSMAKNPDALFDIAAHVLAEPADLALDRLGEGIRHHAGYLECVGIDSDRILREIASDPVNDELPGNSAIGAHLDDGSDYEELAAAAKDNHAGMRLAIDLPATIRDDREDGLFVKLATRPGSFRSPLREPVTQLEFVTDKHTRDGTALLFVDARNKAQEIFAPLSQAANESELQSFTYDFKDTFVTDYTWANSRDLVLGDRDGFLHLLRWESEHEVAGSLTSRINVHAFAKLKAHRESVREVAVSPHFPWVLSGADAGGAVITDLNTWDFTKGKVCTLPVPGNNGGVSGVRWHPSRPYTVSCVTDGGALILYDARAGKDVGGFESLVSVYTHTYSNDYTAWLGHSNGTICSFDIRSLQANRPIKDSCVTSIGYLDYSTEANMLVSMGFGGMTAWHMTDVGAQMQSLAGVQSNSIPKALVSNFVSTTETTDESLNRPASPALSTSSANYKQTPQSPGASSHTTAAVAMAQHSTFIPGNFVLNPLRTVDLWDPSLSTTRAKMQKDQQQQQQPQIGRAAEQSPPRTVAGSFVDNSSYFAAISSSGYFALYDMQERPVASI